MSIVSIRLEQPDDIAGVRETNEHAFGEPLEADLVDTLRPASEFLSLVAITDGRVVGHILFTPIAMDPPVERRIAGLAPMAVRPEQQRTGIGGQLIRAGLEECRRRGYSAVVVLGHPDYYPKFGFVPAHTFGVTCEFPSPPEAFMALELEPRALSGVAGVVNYRPEFAAVG